MSTGMKREKFLPSCLVKQYIFVVKWKYFGQVVENTNQRESNKTGSVFFSYHLLTIYSCPHIHLFPPFGDHGKNSLVVIIIIVVISNFS